MFGQPKAVFVAEAPTVEPSGLLSGQGKGNSQPHSVGDNWPCSLLACLPLLWSRVLFPGQAAGTAPGRWQPLVLLILLPAVLLYPCLSFPLFEPDEGRYAQVPREMLERGDWMVPYLQNEPYLDKPPLMYWLVMLSFSLWGYSDWAARLVPALAVHGCILATYLLGRRSLGERAAWWGAFILCLTPGLLGVGRMLLLDGLLTLWVAVAVLCAFEALRTGRFLWSWWLAGALACGLGVLTKGPVAVVLLVVPLWLQRRLNRQRPIVSWRAVLAFAGLVLVVALPWYLAVCLWLPDFARHFFWEHNVVRFLLPFDHLRPFWYYVPLLVAGLLPASLLLPGLVRFMLSGQEGEAQRRSPELGFFLLAGGWCVLFFSLSGCKLPTYILPAFPFLALVLGGYLASRPWLDGAWVSGLALAAFFFLAGWHFWLVPQLARSRSPMNRPAAVWAYCGDPQVPVLCFPRPIDSVAFYLGRSDLRSFRSKNTALLLAELQKHPRAVVLFSHRHSLDHLRLVLPHNLRLLEPIELGLCHMVKVERLP